MYFEQFYLGCLSHASYLVGSNGEAAVIDPQRDVDQYIESATRHDLAIKFIIETHLHADFVSGHKELAERTGASIVFGSKARAALPHVAVSDGDVLRLGKMSLHIMETPGHTPESICILADDSSNGGRSLLFSGDTLFIGDVGRPDLVGSKGFSAKQMAGFMYDSLRDKLLKLPDDVEIYPAHGAGSLCGKNLSTERSSTIGQQKRFNYALQSMSRETFIEMLTSEQPEIPEYFPLDVEINRRGAALLENLPKLRVLNRTEILMAMNDGAIVLDVRSHNEYLIAHIKGSISIGLNGQFASWAGTLVEANTPIILFVSDARQADEAAIRLARVGIESVIGFIDGGISGLSEADFEIVKSHVISIDELKDALEREHDLSIVDVRRRAEYNQQHLPSAINVPLAELPGSTSIIPRNKPLVVICASGYRSSIAASILEQAKFNLLMNVEGGITAWKDAGYKLKSNVAVQ